MAKIEKLFGIKTTNFESVAELFEPGGSKNANQNINKGPIFNYKQT